MAALSYRWPQMSDFRERYGPYALILGGSEGIGRAFSDAVAARGVAPLVVARASEDPHAAASQISSAHSVDAAAYSIDLGAADAIDEIYEWVGERDVGLVVYVAAFAPTGAFATLTRSQKMMVLDVNCRGPLVTCDAFLPRLVARGKGGLILLSSASAFQGTGWVAAYAASKAFNTILGEGLWWEYREQGVDVLALEPGRTDTPTYRATGARATMQAVAPIQRPEEVAEEGLAALGHVPSHVCGGRGRWLTLALRRALPRRALVAMYGKSTRALFD